MDSRNEFLSVISTFEKNAVCPICICTVHHQMMIVLDTQLVQGHTLFYALELWFDAMKALLTCF